MTVAAGDARRSSANARARSMGLARVLWFGLPDHTTSSRATATPDQRRPAALGAWGAVPLATRTSSSVLRRRCLRVTAVPWISLRSPCSVAGLTSVIGCQRVDLSRAALERVTARAEGGRTDLVDRAGELRVAVIDEVSAHPPARAADPHRRTLTGPGERAGERVGMREERRSVETGCGEPCTPSATYSPHPASDVSRRRQALRVSGVGERVANALRDVANLNRARAAPSPSPPQMSATRAVRGRARFRSVPGRAWRGGRTVPRGRVAVAAGPVW